MLVEILKKHKDFIESPLVKENKQLEENELLEEKVKQLLSI